MTPTRPAAQAPTPVDARRRPDPILAAAVAARLSAALAGRWVAAAAIAALVGACGGGAPAGEPDAGGGGQGGGQGGGDGGAVVQPQPTAHGTPLGAAVSAILGAQGGELSSADGSLTLVVPAGAFATATTVSIQEVTSTAPGAVGRAFRLGPEGLHTPVPMTVRFRAGADATAGTTFGALGIAHQDATGMWRRVAAPASDAATGMLSMKTRHFSDWSMVAGVQLLPHAATLRVGQAIDLRLNHCEDVPDDEGDAPPPSDEDLFPSPLRYVCGSAPTAAVLTTGWAVNGAPGGGAAIGTIAAAADPIEARAVYTAPAVRPSPDTVAVSAVYRPGPEQQLLVASIRIDDALVACEDFASADTLVAHVSFDGFFHTGMAEDLTHSGTHTGKLVVQLNRLTTSDSESVWLGQASAVSGSLVSIADTYAYTPAGQPPTHGSINGSGAPSASPAAPSLVRLRLKHASCRFDVYAGFAVDATTIVNGLPTEGPVGIGSLYLMNQVVPEGQRGSGGFEGTLHVTAGTGIDVTGYVPLSPIGADWTRGGATTARWRFERE